MQHYYYILQNANQVDILRRISLKYESQQKPEYYKRLAETIQSTKNKVATTKMTSGFFQIHSVDWIPSEYCEAKSFVHFIKKMIEVGELQNERKSN